MFHLIVEIMRKMLLLLVNVWMMFASVFSQNSMNLYVALEKQLEWQENPESLALINYKFAHSYTIAKDQIVLRSQLALIDISQYEHLRMPHQTVTVYDPNSGLSIVLKSNDTMQEEMQQIRSMYALASVRE
jgi:hypothetical protein